MDPYLRPLLLASDVPNFTFRGRGKFFNHGGRFDYTFVDKTIFISGGVKESRILGDGLDMDEFMGSDHVPIVLRLHEDWRFRSINLLKSMLDYCTPNEENSSKDDSTIYPNRGHGVEEMLLCEGYDEVKYGELTIDEKMALKDMFSNTKAGQLGAGKTISVPQDRMQSKVLMSQRSNPVLKSDANKPPEFPEEYWSLVDPSIRSLVVERYKSFKDLTYLKECVEKVVNELDICPRDARYKPPWDAIDITEVSESERGRILEGKLLRAQALANIDVYFFPDPDKQELAKDVLAEIHTTDERPFKCKPRKLSTVQQAFLLHKTNMMLKTGKLEHSKSSWCHGLVLVPYTDWIDAFMNKHGDKALEEMFKPEHES